MMGYPPPLVERWREGEQIDRALQVISEITYKPGWTISAFHNNKENPRRGQSIIIEAVYDTYDVDNPTQETTLRQSIMIDCGILQRLSICEIKSTMLRFIRDLIREMELHEVDEWLCHKGNRLVNPHPKG